MFTPPICSTNQLTMNITIPSFKAFMPSNPHNGIPGMFVLAQYTSGTKKEEDIRSDAGCAINNQIHPEVDVINRLTEKLKSQDLDSPNIKIYTSDAPCHECCQKFIQLLQTAKVDHNQDLQIEIVFSGIHRIKRPSCIKKDDCSSHLSRISDNQHQDNVDGLKKLHNTRGVRLRPFTDQDWLDLQRAWRPKMRDETLNRDFEEIMMSDQIQPSQLFIGMSPQTSQADQSKEKVNVPSMSMNHVTPGCNSSEDEKDRIPACKRKREDAGSNEERQEKKVKKQKEEKAKRGLKGTTSKRRGTTSGRGGKISQRGGTTSKKGSHSSGNRSNTAKGKGNTSGRGGNILRRGRNTLRTRGNTAGRGGFISKRGGDTSGKRGNVSGRARNTSGRRGGNISGKRGGNTSGKRGGNTSGKRGGNISGKRGGNTSGKRGGNISGKRGGNTSGKRGGNTSGKRGGNTSGKRGGNTSGKRGGNTSGKRGNVSRRRTTTGRGGHTS
ncbi:translation initiation factor IF-2-like isoform X1 [Pomacea canaliculata]|uniref:translation initiation factor IF-2-like isoform X1 n=1 Tax=Pomacea canaliculata TaxID=400727 RepID=UPI000D73E929|nr:translation initiation factor IF-2-like isoform X1 [Pomacea canaliculata]